MINTKRTEKFLLDVLSNDYSTYIICSYIHAMPEPTSMGGGYSCQVCGSTYETQQKLIEHGREQHPGKEVTWGYPADSTPNYERDTGVEEKGESMADKMKAGAKAIGSKMKDPDRDLKAEYQKKKEE